MANRIWLPDEDETIRRERERKTPVPAIAAMLNRPVPATYLRARKLDTRVQKHEVWSDAEETRFKELMTQPEPPCDRELAAAFKRSLSSIRWKVRDLGFVGARPLGLSAAQKRALQEQARERASARVATVKTVNMVARAAIVDRAEKPKVRDRSGPGPIARAVQSAVAGLLTKAMFGANAAATAAAKDRAEAKREQDRLLVEVNKRLAKEASAARRAQAKAAAIAARDLAREAKLAESRAAREEARAAKQAARAEARAAAETARAIRAARAKPPRPKAPARVVNATEARPVSHAAPERVVVAPVVTFDPKAVVISPPLAPATKTSGRGGWAVTRRHRQTIAPKVKATRDDALALAEAAKDAVAAFIAARGVTRAVDDATTSLINRLRARGYIIIQTGKGWMVDHRHEVKDATALEAFAAARGLLTKAAA
jgi:hypothetical protein